MQEVQNRCVGSRGSREQPFQGILLTFSPNKYKLTLSTNWAALPYPKYMLGNPRLSLGFNKTFAILPGKFSQIVTILRQPQLLQDSNIYVMHSLPEKSPKIKKDITSLFKLFTLTMQSNYQLRKKICYRYISYSQAIT